MTFFSPLLKPLWVKSQFTWEIKYDKLDLDMKICLMGSLLQCLCHLAGRILHHETFIMFFSGSTLNPIVRSIVQARGKGKAVFCSHTDQLQSYDLFPKKMQACESHSLDGIGKETELPNKANKNKPLYFEWGSQKTRIYYQLPLILQCPSKCTKIKSLPLPRWSCLAGMDGSVNCMLVHS